MTALSDKIQSEERLILAKMKRLAVTDCAYSLPKAHREFYLFDSIKATFACCGFVNKIEAYPDVHAVIRVVNAAFSSNLKFKSLFVNRIFDCTL